jgi:hypothetical protein
MRRAFGLQIVEGGGSDGNLEVCRNDSNHFLAITCRRNQECSTPYKIQGQAVKEVALNRPMNSRTTIRPLFAQVHEVGATSAPKTQSVSSVGRFHRPQLRSGLTEQGHALLTHSGTEPPKRRRHRSKAPSNLICCRGGCPIQHLLFTSKHWQSQFHQSVLSALP